MDYLIQGKKGNGKSLVAVAKIRDYLRAGKPVATNLDLNLESMLSPLNTSVVYRIPDHPSAADLSAIGYGSPSPDEETFGALVLDECGTWLNAREWQNPARKPFINWLLHGRKFGWDCFYLIQDASLIDSQVRASVCELIATCRRLDRINIPFVTRFLRNFGIEVKLPKIHFATVRYGLAEDSVVADKWYYMARDLYAAYDTRQVFQSDYSDGVYCLLPPWHTKGRYMSKMSLYGKAVMSALAVGLAVGVGLGAVGAQFFKIDKPAVKEAKKDKDGKEVKVSAYVVDEKDSTVWLSDGRVLKNPLLIKVNGKPNKVNVDHGWLGVE